MKTFVVLAALAVCLIIVPSAKSGKVKYGLALRARVRTKVRTRGRTRVR